MRVLIITAGRYPVPATKGGAVSTLVDHLVNDNEIEKKLELEVTSPYEKRAFELAKMYENCKFYFIKTPIFFRFIENFSYELANCLAPKRNWTQLKSAFSFIWFLIRNALLLRRNNYDYVVIENTARLFLCFKLFGNSKKYKDKIIYHLHNDPHKLGGCRNIINQSKYILCISEYIKGRITNCDGTIKLEDSSKALVYRNCVNTSKFRPYNAKHKRELREKYGFTQKDKIIVFSGRIDQEKGIKEVLMAMEQIKTSDVKLLIVGSSFYGMKVKTKFEAEIIKLAADLKERVIFTGFLPYEEMPDVYNVANIAVLPSIWQEPAGLTIIEAMACGLPVITTNVGGIPEYTNEKAAILLDVNDHIIESIAESIDNCFRNEILTQSMGKCGCEHVRTYFDSSHYLNTFINLIENT